MFRPLPSLSCLALLAMACGSSGCMEVDAGAPPNDAGADSLPAVDGWVGGSNDEGDTGPGGDTAVDGRTVGSPEDDAAVDGGAVGSSEDAAVDGGAVGAIDSGAVDGGVVGAVDSGAGDSGAGDSGAGDSGAVDSGAGDSGAGDSGAVDELPVQDGGACHYAGRDYADCYVGQTWTGPQRLVGVNDVLVLRSTIDGGTGESCLYLRDANNISIVDVDITGCDRAGIQLSNQVASSNVRIVGGTITDTGRTSGANGSCIAVGELAPGLVIDGVELDECGFDEYDHGIYVQAPDYVIRNVVIHDVSGNGISVRTSGTVQGCSVRGSTGAGKARIRYYNDHPCGPSSVVRFIDNDVDYDASPGDYDISLIWSSTSDACDNYELLGNGPSSTVEYHIDPEFDALSVTLEE